MSTTDQPNNDSPIPLTEETTILGAGTSTGSGTPSAQSSAVPAAPEEPTSTALPATRRSSGFRARTVVFGLLGLTAGGLYVAASVTDLRIDYGNVWLGALIAAGIVLVVSGLNRRQNA